MDYDFTKGRMVENKEIIHHAAVDGISEEGHYETIAEYPNGGKDVIWVIDVPAVKASDAYDEEKITQEYVPYTAEELAEIEANKVPTLEERLAAVEAVVKGTPSYGELLEAVNILLGETP